MDKFPETPPPGETYNINDDPCPNTVISPSQSMIPVQQAKLRGKTMGNYHPLPGYSPIAEAGGYQKCSDRP